MRRVRRCLSCKTSNRPGAIICDQCGTALPRGPALPPTVPENWTTDLARPRVQAAHLLMQACTVSYRLIEHRLVTMGITVAQCRALAMVGLLPPPVTASILALHLSLDPRTVSGLVARLEEHGWLRRVHDLPDRRTVRLELTARGEQQLAHSWKPAVKAGEESWLDIPAADLGCTELALRRVVNSTRWKLGYLPDEPSPVVPQDSPA